MCSECGVWTDFQLLPGRPQKQRKCINLLLLLFLIGFDDRDYKLFVAVYGKDPDYTFFHICLDSAVELRRGNLFKFEILSVGDFNLRFPFIYINVFVHIDVIFDYYIIYLKLFLTFIYIMILYCNNLLGRLWVSEKVESTFFW